MRIYFIAGEASGDLIGGKIITQLKALDQSIDCLGIGGSAMLSAGLRDLLFPMQEISLFGFFEILPQIFKLKKLIRKTIADILTVQPDIVVTIDSPGFCFRVIERIKALAPKISRIHVVAPSVWAYKPERAIKVASLYNHLLTLLPFEAPLFEKYGLSTTYMGHPIFEQDFSKPHHDDDSTRYADLKDNTQAARIVLTPGSRISEIKRHLPVFAKALKKLEVLPYCTIVADNHLHHPLIHKILEKHKLKYLITQDKLAAFKAADLVLAKSGTNTLEIAACKTPMIVIYKVNMLSWWFWKCISNIKYVSLINIVADSQIVPELLQNDATAHNLAKKIREFLTNHRKMQKQVEKSQEVLQKMGLNQTLKPSQIAAKTIILP
jgi:lipid-A-disaccharide synthase